jgi:hypothetical protein
MLPLYHDPYTGESRTLSAGKMRMPAEDTHGRAKRYATILLPATRV